MTERLSHNDGVEQEKKSGPCPECCFEAWAPLGFSHVLG